MQACAKLESGHMAFLIEALDRFHEDLVGACVELLTTTRLSRSPEPSWVTCVPSTRDPELLPDFAQRLAEALELPFAMALCRTEEREPQASMANAVQQARNVDGAFGLCDEVTPAPVLLVDGIVGSRWTLTMTTWLLREGGCSHVWPLALAMRRSGG